MSGVKYNEIEPYAADWLESLSAAGHVASGVVDRRSVAALAADDVRGLTQFHTFAGIGVWSYALRLAGWPDDREVWTGSCPCQPFSQAGKRGGTEDARHLWPEWFRLIRECRPASIFGEQVASPDGLKWLDAVRADLEGAGYAFGAADLCAAGVGAPHIRQRLYFHARLADTDSLSSGQGSALIRGGIDRGDASPRAGFSRCGEARGMVDASSSRGGGDSGTVPGAETESRRKRRLAWYLPDEPVVAGPVGGLDHHHHQRPQGHTGAGGERNQPGRVRATEAGFIGTTGATRGFWANAEWLPCRDGKWRPVEPGTFPLAHGATNRMGKLRAYGNGLVSEVAATFIKAVMGC